MPVEEEIKTNPKKHQQLSLAARPRTFKQVIGQQKTVNSIRKICEASWPKAWLFSGPSGAGKTTIAHILALSYQCTHSEIVGTPCLDCRKNKGTFDIYEIDMAKLTGKSDVEEALAGVYFAPFGHSRYRVYILDECHMATKNAQSLLLKMMEEGTPDTTVFMLCTTAPQSVLTTIRGRCKNYAVRELDYDGIKELVTYLLKRIKSDLDAVVLTEALVDASVFSARLICHAVEKYAAGSTAEEAAMVDTVTEVNTLNLINHLLAGNWTEVAKMLYQIQNADIRNVRASVIGMLRKILLDSPEIDTKTKATAKALSSITAVHNTDDLTLAANIASELYLMCENFQKYSQ